MAEHTALSQAEDWLQRQPYFNPNAPDLINKVAEATGIIRAQVTINADLLEALDAIKFIASSRGLDSQVTYDAILEDIEDRCLNAIEQAIRKAEEHINRDIDHEETLDHEQTISDARHAGCP